MFCLVRRRARHMVQSPKHSGVACMHTTDTAACGAVNCPVDCIMNAWAGWGGTTGWHKCGHATRARTVRTYVRTAVLRAAPH